MMKLLMGGSPCTHWSIAQTKNRETEPSGLGWELFENYLIALRKYKPDYFLYENNKSMAPAIRAQITKELGVEPILINSALVSAQNRQRLYWTNIPGVTQPKDMGILLRDVLESTTYENGKAQCLRASYYKDGIRNMVGNTIDRKTCVAELVRIGTMPTDGGEITGSQANRIYSVDGKSVSLKANGGGWGAKTGLYAVPCCVAQRGRYTGADGCVEQHFEPREDEKTNTLTTVQKDNMVAVPLTETEHTAIERLVEKYGYVPEMFHAYNTAEITDKSPTLSTGSMRTSSCAVSVICSAEGKTYPVYEVRNGLITIKGKQYPIKLPDGFYIIRKLTVTECKRLQTVPDSYIFPVSDSQAYKMLGNGWTVDVIAHILSHIDGISKQEVEVLSMYDGMSCGHIALDNLGANVVRYYASEIDKYAIQTTMANYPRTIQIGDAFQVRKDGWSL